MVDIKDRVAQLDGWALSDKKIEKIFTFKDFKSAFAFMTSCAAYAEEINHHPDWSNVYNKVEVSLTTHDVSGLSDLDFQMASFMDKVFNT